AYAWRTAADRYEAALALIEDTPDHAGTRGWLLTRVAFLRRWSNLPLSIARAEEAVRVAAPSGDRALMAFSMYALGMLHGLANEWRRAIAELEVGVVALEALAPEDQARLRANVGGNTDVRHFRSTLAFYLAASGRYAEAL